MDLPRLSKKVRRITVLERDGSGALASVVVFKRRRKGKKGSRALRPLERLAKMAVDAGDAYSSDLRSRYKKSNRKRRDGWLRDFPVNLTRSGRKGLRKFSVTRFLTL
jgi:Family of unknown function (DUF6312)